MLAITLFCLVYMICAPRPLSTELYLVPDWTEDISRVQEGKEGDVLIPFRLSQNIGFFTPDGRVVSSITFPFKAAISECWYATYGAANRATELHRPTGETGATINAEGFPFFDADRIYLFLPGGTSFARYSEDGNQLWKYESYAPITAFSSTEGGTVAGFADGNMVSFTKDGSIDQRFAPGGSAIPVILGAAISGDGKLIACVSGREQQRFVLAQKSGGHSKIMFHEYAEQDLVTQVLVHFNRAADTVYYNYNGGLGIVDIAKLSSSHVPIKGTIVQIEESEVENLVFILSKDENRYTVTALEPFDHPAAQFSFEGESAFIKVHGEALFVGRNNKISRLTVARK